MRREWAGVRVVVEGIVGRGAAPMAVAAALAVMLAAGSARAQSVVEVVSFSHKYQFGLHVQGGLGYRGIFPYDEEFCGELDDDGGTKASCLGRTPFAMDVGLSFGVTDRLELLAEARVGLERDIGEVSGDDEGPRSIAIAPGIKGYIAEIGPGMLFATLQFAVDFTGYEQIDETDFGVRNVNGFQFDLNDNFGFFIFVGEQVAFRRWLSFEVEAGLGAQLRVP
jgi:hypothetical protein